MNGKKIICVKPYINILLKDYDGRFPPFYDCIDDSSIIEVIENNYDVFFRELNLYKDIRESTEIPKLKILYNENGWNTIILYNYGLRYHNVCKHFPQTLKILGELPEIVTIYFSTIKGGAKLRPHYGDTDATYRIHLGIDIPEGLPNCGLEVGGIIKGWSNGKTLIFNDAHYHTAWNLTDKDRTVLIIDVLKPEFLKKKWLVLPQILGALGLGRMLFFFNLLYKLPKPIIVLLHYLASFLFLFILPIQRRLKF